MDVHRLRARTDNYVWLMHDPASGEAAVVDPSEAAPVEAALTQLGAQLTAIWCTHHHFDHVGGNEELCARWPGVVVYGGKEDLGRIPRLTVPLDDGDEVVFAGERARVWFIPGHTRGHVAYVLPGRVFCGDTLFGGGCGRLFEGTPEMMHSSLSGKLAHLPEATRVYCGHEYTASNLRFAVHAEPDNQAAQAKLEGALAPLPLGEPTVPSTIGAELATNPFLRCALPTIRARFPGETPVEVFAAVRRAKDSFR